MSEPITSGVAGAAGWKIIGGTAGALGIGGALAAFVVMCMTKPRSDSEWRVALVSTLMSSFGGGCAVIMHYELQAWAHSMIGLIAMIGLVFSCGLPGWAVVRWVFNYINKHQDADIADVAKEVKDIV